MSFSFFGFFFCFLHFNSKPWPAGTEPKFSCAENSLTKSNKVSPHWYISLNNSFWTAQEAHDTASSFSHFTTQPYLCEHHTSFELNEKEVYIQLAQPNYMTAYHNKYRARSRTKAPENPDFPTYLWNLEHTHFTLKFPTYTCITLWRSFLPAARLSQ